MKKEEGYKGMKYRDVDALLKIFKKLAKTVEVIPRWENAKRIKILKEIIGPIDTAREVTDEMKSYYEKQDKIFEKYGTPVSSQGGMGYRIENWGPVNEEIAILKEENRDLLEKEIERKKDIELLLDKDVEVNIEPIDYEWCGDLIDGNDLVVLMDFDLVNEPMSDEEAEEAEDAKLKNIRNSKKRARKK
jgi:hypothetical protein